MMIGHQGQALPLLVFSLLLTAMAAEQNENTDKTGVETAGQGEKKVTADINSEEFERWIMREEEKVVQRILEKIETPGDSVMQHEAKIAVARYLVNVTFTAMTRRLGLSKISKRQASFPATAELPSSPVVEEPTVPLVEMLPEAVETTTPVLVVAESATTSPTLPPTKETLAFSPQNSDSSLPSSSVGEFSPFPVSSPILENVTDTTATGNETETTTVPATPAKPIWEELLTFNFSAALMGGREGGPSSLLSRIRGGNNGSEGGTGGSIFSRFNLTALGGGGGGGGGLLSRLNLTALRGGGEGGGLLGRLNLTALQGNGTLFERLNISLPGGGNGIFERLNISLPGGGRNGSIFERLNITLPGGGRNGSIFQRLNISLPGSGGGEGSGGLLGRFNLSALSSGGQGGGGLLNRFNLSTGGEEGAPPAFNIPAPPEGLFNYPTPPPKNDSVKLSQMYLGNQVEKLMGDINNTNLTGIVESTINIATPSTVGVLVNALLNIVLCNPLDRFNGNCGLE